MFSSDRWRALWAMTGRLPAHASLAIATAGLLLVGAGDCATGREFSFSLFYVIPISQTAWMVGRTAGTAVSVAAAAIWLAADRLAGTVYSADWIAVWNSLIRLGFFLIISALIAQVRTTLETEQQLARTDPMTGVLNNRTFADAVTAELARARRYHHPMALAFLDLDDFKGVNDRLGHHAGDDLLRSIGLTLMSATRDTDVVGRLGGDEFAVVFPETGREGAVAVAHKLLAGITALHPDGISIGVVTCEIPPASAEELIRAADDAMYEAKRQGKNRIEFRPLETAGRRD